MSPIYKELLDRAEEIRLSNPEEVAVGILKQAGLSDADARMSVAQHIMEKEAVNQLVTTAGINIEQAVSLVKAAGVNLKDLATFSAPVADIDPTIELLQKAAEYIDELEQKLEASLTPEVILPENITKAASSGAFTNEDLAMLKSMDQVVLQKVASAMEPAWEMGRGAGMARPKTDPILEFILG